MNSVVIDSVPGPFKRPARLYTDHTGPEPVVELQFQHGWGRLKWWRTYFVSEVTWATTTRAVQQRLVRDAVRLGL